MNQLLQNHAADPPVAVNRAWNEAACKAGVDKSPHAARHALLDMRVSEEDLEAVLNDRAGGE